MMKRKKIRAAAICMTFILSCIYIKCGEQIKGDGILRLRERKYGGLRLHIFEFYDLRLSVSPKLKKVSVEVGAVYQK